MQQFAVKLAQALASGKIADLETSFQKTALPTLSTHIDTPQTVTSHHQPPSKLRTEATWATVAARNKPANQTTPPPGTTPSQSTTPKTDNPQITQPKTDNRLFVRLNPEHSLRQLHPYHIQKHLSPALNDTHLASIHITPTGLALKHSTGKDALALEKKKEQIKKLCGASAVELADPWVKFWLPAAPRWLNTLDGRKEVTLDEVRAEITQAFNIQPVRVRWGTPYKNKQARDSCPLLVDFRKAILPSAPAEVQLFFTRVQVQARIITKKPTQCYRCWAFHRPETCSHSPRCEHCATTSHRSEQHEHKLLTAPTCGATAGQCRCPDYCANCNGPHKASDARCPLRPQPDKPLKTKKQIISIRQAGRAHRAAINFCSPQPPIQQQPNAHADA